MSVVPRDRSLRTAFSECVNVASWLFCEVHESPLLYSATGRSGVESSRRRLGAFDVCSQCSLNGSCRSERPWRCCLRIRPQPALRSLCCFFLVPVDQSLLRGCSCWYAL